MREIEQKFKIIQNFSECFTDHCDPEKIEQTVYDLLAQRIFGLALSYEACTFCTRCSLIKNYRELFERVLLNILKSCQDNVTFVSSTKRIIHQEILTSNYSIP